MLVESVSIDFRGWLARGVLLTLCLLLIFSGNVFAGPGHQSNETVGQYRISFSDNLLSASVEARIPVKDGRLFMAAWGADHLPAGWATFIRNFEVRDESDRQLRFTSKPNGVWELADRFNGTVKLTYQIDFSFSKQKWPYGNEQAAVFQNDALFVVSKALFVVSDASGKRHVVIQTPSYWKVSTPWLALNANPRTFVVEDNNDLINNSLVLGKHFEYVFNEGRFTFVLALLGRTGQSSGLIAATLQKVVRNYIRIFDKTPQSKYLMTVFHADVVDSEAYAKSAAFSERDPITKNSLIRWGNTLAHELFHAWNGHAIRGADYATSQWFSEGFTEYFANLALVQEGLITKDLFIKKMENHLGLYLYFKEAPAFDGATLKEAGSRKGRYRLGVYNGGWAVAFSLDVLIRSETNNRKSLVNFMRLMHERFGLTRRQYRYEDLVSLASETSGRNLDDFFKKYVEGKESLPVQDYLKQIGLNGYTQFYDGEFYIVDAPVITFRQRRLQQSILTGVDQGSGRRIYRSGRND